MSFISKLFAFKFLWLEDIFNSMAKVWHDLTIEEQQISVQASGIIAVINANLAATPDVLFEIIEAKFPTLTKDQVADYLTGAGKILTIADQTAALSFDDAIKLFQGYLGKQQGNGWIAITTSAVNALLTIMLPSTTPLQKITIALEYIYQHFVKPMVTAS